MYKSRNDYKRSICFPYSGVPGIGRCGCIPQAGRVVIRAIGRIGGVNPDWAASRHVYIKRWNERDF